MIDTNIDRLLVTRCGKCGRTAPEGAHIVGNRRGVLYCPECCPCNEPGRVRSLSPAEKFNRYE